ncbi:hypothetical protein SAMN04488072_11823 [Lentibacillus halodurans]|uniref:Uncharacterized protein n=1 Tax=Lentibacillus halodurans TaxID=237679 RepID=A0A1I1AB88_9BACI|nr:hypothetical protein [Lentibacillus halodurans]SFB35217.1 hypothetical protein SAMN04488072_11823 [Lentibacillus halodurans]
MKKRANVMIVAVIAVILVISSYWVYGQSGVELATNTTKEVQEGDFTLHIRVERMDEGVRVFRAIQYTGDESVEIKHQTPLVSVSLKHSNHDYTGSTVSRTLHTADSYHPQDAKTFDVPGEGAYTLFCEANFSVDGEQMTISHQEELIFQ